MIEDCLARLRTFSPGHRRYIMQVINEIIRHYGDDLVGCAVFGSYARGENLKNSDLDLLVILKKAPGFSRRLQDFVDNIEMKHEDLGQELYDLEEVFCELSPYILSREEALKMQPIYFDLVEHHLVIYDPFGVVKRIIDSTGRILREAGARKVWRSGRWEWHLGDAGFTGGMDL